MKKQVITYSFVVLLGVVIGLLLYPMIFGKMGPSTPFDTRVVPDSSFMSSAPDTFWVEQDTIYILKYMYQDTGSTEIMVDTVYIAEERPVVTSHKFFEHGNFILSNVWVKGPTQIYTIDNSVVVNWQRHFDAVYSPRINTSLSKAKTNNLLKGIAAGGIFTAGLMSGDWRIAAGATIVGGGIIIIF